MQFTHLINPVAVGPSSDLHTAQPVTFESMRRAQRATRPEVQVRLAYTCYAEDRAVVPADFQASPDLERSVLDVRTFGQARKLPLIKDIFDRLYGLTSEGEYLIYSNVDIAVMPFFYEVVAEKIAQGYDAFVINRRTITSDHTLPAQLPLMYAEVGTSHPGFDCFVFPRALYPQFQLGEACLGANWIGRVIIVNLMTLAHNFKIFDDQHLSFHLGDDRSWRNPAFADYDAFNREELIKVIERLLPLAHQQGAERPQLLKKILYRDLGYGRPSAPPQRRFSIKRLFGLKR